MIERFETPRFSFVFRQIHKTPINIERKVRPHSHKYAIYSEFFER